MLNGFEKGTNWCHWYFFMLIYKRRLKVKFIFLSEIVYFLIHSNSLSFCTKQVLNHLYQSIKLLVQEIL